MLARIFGIKRAEGRITPPSPAASHRLRLVLLIFLSVVASGCRPSIHRPDILLITSDALRADHLSFNGYSRVTSPHLDLFGMDAINFDQAISVIPKTGPSFATLFTGLQPSRHGVQYNKTSLPANLPVLAERFKALGYRTAAFVSNPVLRASKGYARGFDLYRELPGVSEVNRAYLDWAKSDGEGPTFVWIHYIDPHGPYDPPEGLETPFLHDALSRSEVRIPFDERKKLAKGGNKILGAIPKYQQRGLENRLAAYVARYDGEIRHMDRAFGEVIADLKLRNLYDESAIVFTADHGESLGEHNYYFEHGWFAFDASLRVPLLIKWPGQTQAATRSQAVSQIDLFPTLLAIAGEASPPKDTSGFDLFQISENRAAILVQNAYNYPERYFGIRSPEFKYLVRKRDGREAFYDLRADPKELRDLVPRIDSQPQATTPEARAALRTFRQQADRLRKTGSFQNASAAPPEVIDKASKRALESLGYLDPSPGPGRTQSAPEHKNDRSSQTSE